MLAAALGILVCLPFFVLLIGMLTDPEVPDEAFICLFIPPIVHFCCSLGLRWWDWRLALVYCIPLCSVVFAITCCSSSMDISSVAGILGSAALAFVWPLTAWAFARGVRTLVQRGYL